MYSTEQRFCARWCLSHTPACSPPPLLGSCIRCTLLSWQNTNMHARNKVCTLCAFYSVGFISQDSVVQICFARSINCWFFSPLVTIRGPAKLGHMQVRSVAMNVYWFGLVARRQTGEQMVLLFQLPASAPFLLKNSDFWTPSCDSAKNSDFWTPSCDSAKRCRWRVTAKHACTLGMRLQSKVPLLLTRLHDEHAAWAETAAVSLGSTSHVTTAL